MINKQKLLESHISLVSNIEFTKVINKNSYSLCFNKQVKDVFSNFALIKQTTNLTKSIQGIEQFFLEQDRKPSVYVLDKDYQKIKKILTKRGYNLSFKDSILTLLTKDAKRKKFNLKFKDVSDNKQLEDYLAISKEVFSSGVKGEPYSNMPRDYFKQLASNWGDIQKRKKIRYVIAYKGKKIIGIGSIVLGKNIAYLFDLAVIKSERKKGYAKEILTKRILSAKKQGIKIVYLFTEDKSFNDLFYQRFGFKKLGVGICCTKR